MIEYRPLLFIIGILLSVLALLLLVPAIVDIFAQNNDWVAFLMSAFLTAFVGISLILTNKTETFNLNIKQAFLLTTLSWTLIAAFGALPFVFSEQKLSYTDAFFETMSGITTTGASVMFNLDKMPPGILLWRSLLTGMGGIGIIVFALAILPMLKVAGMQLFKTESSDKSDKIMPRMTQISLAITIVYFSLFGLCAFGFWLAGMSAFDAIAHSFPIISTAGYATHDAGFAYWDNSYIDYIAVVFMILSALPFVLYVQLARGEGEAFLKDEQVKWFLSIVFIAIAIMTLWLIMEKNYDFSKSLRYASFSVVSLITTTGFANTDFALWGTFADAFLFMLIVIGGCTGGTTGGIKIFRFQILYQTAKTQLIQLIQPHAIVRMRYNGKAIPDGVTSSVMSFIILYGFAFMMVAIILAFCGMDFISSMSASATCLSNTGPGLGTSVGPMGNYAHVPNLGKWALSFAMLLGRLEIFTILVLFTPKFWRD